MISKTVFRKDRGDHYRCEECGAIFKDHQLRKDSLFPPTKCPTCHRTIVVCINPENEVLF